LNWLHNRRCGSGILGFEQPAIFWVPKYMMPAPPQITPLEEAAGPAVQSFVVVSKFTIANGLDDAVQNAFCERPHMVDDAPGFLGMEVMHPVGKTAEVWLVTRWADEPSYRTWHRSHDYHASHKGIPKGLKLVRGSTEIQAFHVFAN